MKDEVAVRYSARDVLLGAAGEPEIGELRAVGTWGGGMRTEISAGRHRIVSDEPTDREGDDAGPSPLELALAALCACSTVTMKRMADKLRMRVGAFEIDTRGVIDRRGRKGIAPVPAHFLRIEVRARIETAESDERVRRLQELVERHCPMATLFQAAPCEFVSTWQKVGPVEGVGT